MEKLKEEYKTPTIDTSETQIANVLMEIKQYCKISDEKIDGVPGKIYDINLPEIGNFKGFNFKFFVNKEPITIANVVNKENLKTIDDIIKLFESIREWMKAKGIEIDKNIDYNKLVWPKEDDSWISNCEAGEILDELTGLRKKDGLYLLQKNNGDGPTTHRILEMNRDSYLKKDNCCFRKVGTDGTVFSWHKMYYILDVK